MRRLIAIITLLVLQTSFLVGQNIVQTVRGTVLDIDSKLPLLGATITIPNSDPFIGTTTNLSGEFRLEEIPVGRTTLMVSFMGYESKTLSDVIVGSGKEVVLTVNLQESAVKMNEVVIKGNDEKGEVLNDMSLVSGRSISVEESKRYAGSFDDPSRILFNFAGVTNSQNAENDIIIRGNSPKYVQWRLEGTEITNPTHFADQNGVKGGISALNNKLLATSDFYTGAFSPEYGDVLSGVYDVKLRVGNNEKFEAAVGLGLIGTDITLEGPLKKGYGGSYLVNYRYSTISMISDLGLVNIDGVLNYQDATFKVVLPTKSAGVFSFFGLTGLSGFKLEDVDPNLQATPGNERGDSLLKEDYNKTAFLVNTGLNHTLSLSNSSYLRTTLSYSNNGVNERIYETQTTKLYDNQNMFIKDSVGNRALDDDNKLIRSTYRAAVTYNHKLNTRNKIQVGVKYALFDYDNGQSMLLENGDRFNLVKIKEDIGTFRSFASWRHHVNNNLTLVAGLHNMNVIYNSKSTLESRLAVQWKMNKRNRFSIGYGEHSSMESVHNYFARVPQADGSVLEPNKDLELLRANHLVLGYKGQLTKKASIKVDAYYQYLSNLPVENNDTSYYSTINEGNDFRYVDLVNEGKGKNYGVEVTLEQFLSNNFYFLINGSLYNSTYTALDGKERNTLYNGNYLVNVLFGKEFLNLGKKKNRSLSINAKIFYGGGQKHIPLLRDNQGGLAVNPAQGSFYDYDKAYEDKLDDVFQIDLSASYTINKKKSSHEIFVNLINLSNNTSRISEYYDQRGRISWLY